jgi:hypothetical protein
MNLQSGLPISIGSNANTTNSFGGAQRPDKIGPSETEGGIYDRRLNYINAASFVNPAQFTFGTTGRNLPDLRAPIKVSVVELPTSVLAINFMVGLAFVTRYYTGLISNGGWWIITASVNVRSRWSRTRGSGNQLHQSRRRLSRRAAQA